MKNYMKKKKYVLKTILIIVTLVTVMGLTACVGIMEDVLSENESKEDLSDDKESEKEAGDSSDDKGEVVYIDESEIDYIYSDPSSYKGKYVILSGKVFGEPERDDEGVYLQMWQKPEEAENNTIIAYEGNVDVQDGDYVLIDGEIKDEYKGENAFGGMITAPMILAKEMTVLSYQEAVAPTIKEILINEVQEQYGYEVVLEKIEIAENETRVYLTINNNGSSAFSAYSFNADLVQGSNQYEEDSNWEADYPEIQTDLRVGATTSGIFCFPAINLEEEFTVYIDASSDNYDEDIEEYQFVIENN